ncbi:MAG: class I SAM-dependent methyltransferase [Caldilineaceae bacterium]|nr:class I SAM-dependent methyltransferase [Caldilineaceae bacterium]
MTDENSVAAVFDRFAPFYDQDYRDYNEDVEAIYALASESGGPLLELGCGTGRLLLPLAEAGFHMTGIDISPGLLAIARQKLAAAGVTNRVDLVQTDLRSYELAQTQFGFAFCTSNTLMHLTTGEEQLAVLQNVWRHLRADGRLLIDLFNPDVPRLLAVNGLMELADRWHDDMSGADVIKWSVRTVDLAEQIQETLFIYEELLPDGRTQRTSCPFTLRFLWRSEAELMLRLAGFVVDEVWGDFEGSPYDSISDHLILLAHKP